VRLLRYSARRLALLIPVLLGVSVLTFALVRILPGDPVRTVVPETATAADIADARERFGLDRSIPEQYGIYLGDLVQGDFGTSFQTGTAITTELGERLGATFELVTLALVVALLIGIPIGLFAGLRAGRRSDQVVRVGALAGAAVSEFWLGLLAILVFYRVLGIAPAPSGRLGPDVQLDSITSIEPLDALLSGNIAALGSSLAHLALPVLTLAVVTAAPVIRMVRAAAIEVVRSDAYRCAEAHGLPRRLRVRGYVARQSLIGLPTLTALLYGTLIGNAVLIEFVFSWQGFGQWALEGMRLRDYPVIQAFVLITAAVYLVVFLVADVLHAWLDPRVRL
jgi:peptide/nickel transport system permease protein